jgi:hypothetical protein
MSKQKLTLYADAAIVEKMKIRAIREKKSLSVITEELYRGFLRSKPTKGKK